MAFSGHFSGFDGRRGNADLFGVFPEIELRQLPLADKFVPGRNDNLWEIVTPRS